MNNYLNKNFWKEDDNHINVGVCNEEGVFSDTMQNTLMELENDSWWFGYRAKVIINLMNRFFDASKLTLDIGSGNGFTSAVAIEQGYRVGIIEPSYVACVNAKKRGIKEINCGMVTSDTIVDDSIDQVLLLDVLEHMDDDAGFLCTLNSKLVSDGRVLITVPAFMSLWSGSDELAKHFRRYRINNLCKLVESQGFEVCYKSYYMSFLYFPILIFRVYFEKLGLVKKRGDQTGEMNKTIEREFKNKSVFVSKILSLFEMIETKLMMKNNRVWFGSSIVIVARKP